MIDVGFVLIFVTKQHLGIIHFLQFLEAPTSTPINNKYKRSIVSSISFRVTLMYISCYYATYYVHCLV
jgi:hypothetical protein